MTPVGLPPRASIDWAMRKINTKQMEAMNRIKRETTRKKNKKRGGSGIFPQGVQGERTTKTGRGSHGIHKSQVERRAMEGD